MRTDSSSDSDTGRSSESGSDRDDRRERSHSHHKHHPRSHRHENRGKHRHGNEEHISDQPKRHEKMRIDPWDPERAPKDDLRQRDWRFGICGCCDGDTKNGFNNR